MIQVEVAPVAAMGLIQVLIIFARPESVYYCIIFCVLFFYHLGDSGSCVYGGDHSYIACHRSAGGRHLLHGIQTVSLSLPCIFC